jgi:hypothetical protein
LANQPTTTKRISSPHNAHTHSLSVSVVSIRVLCLSTSSNNVFSVEQKEDRTNK